jgi:hypothetical protein
MLHAAARHTKRRPRHTRSGVTLPRGDGRTVAARRFRDLVEAYSAELGGKLSPVEQSLVRQAANLTQVSERLQADVIAGTPVDHDAMVRISSEARRILGMLRAKAAKNKPAGPNLQEYLAQTYPKAAYSPVLILLSRSSPAHRRATLPTSH